MSVFHKVNLKIFILVAIVFIIIEISLSNAYPEDTSASGLNAASFDTANGCLTPDTIDKTKEWACRKGHSSRGEDLCCAGYECECEFHPKSDKHLLYSEKDICDCKIIPDTNSTQAL